MKQIELASGTANVTVMVNLTSSTGTPVTGITYSGVPNCTYIREGDSAPTAITLVAGTVGTYVAGCRLIAYESGVANCPILCYCRRRIGAT